MKEETPAKREFRLQKKREYYAKNRERLCALSRFYISMNKEKINAVRRERRKNNPQCRALAEASWQKLKNDPVRHAKLLAYRKQYRARYNPPRLAFLNEQKRLSLLARGGMWHAYTKRRMERDPDYRARTQLSKRMAQALKSAGAKKFKTTREFLGADPDVVRAYIESKFKPGMTWDNHGRGRDKWHIDHIIPCASFDLTNPQEQLRCFHYTNLQPLWEAENLLKSDKILQQQNLFVA